MCGCRGAHGGCQTLFPGSRQDSDVDEEDRPPHLPARVLKTTFISNDTVVTERSKGTRVGVLFLRHLTAK